MSKTLLRIIVNAVLRIEKKVDAVLVKLNQQGELTMADLSRIQSAVAAETTVVDSVKTLLSSLAAQLKAASGDQTAVNAIADQMVALNQAMADAVTANTPASPTPAPAPAPSPAPTPATPPTTA